MIAMPRARSTLPAATALGCLIALHALVDVLIAMARWLNCNGNATDIMATAVPQAQLCLLAIWLVVGTQPWTWRLSGLLAGLSFLFIVFTRFALPRDYPLGATSYWLDSEWQHYFQYAGPGDLLVKTPWLIAAVASPLWAVRKWRPKTTRQLDTRKGLRKLRREAFRFGLRDMAVWTASLSVVMVAIFQTAPYSRWWFEMFTAFCNMYRPQNPGNLYRIAIVTPYAMTALAALWAVGATTPGRWRVVLAVAIASVRVSDIVWPRFVQSFVAALRPDDTPTIYWEHLAVLVVAAVVSGTLLVVKAYRGESGEWRGASGEWRVASGEWRGARGEGRVREPDR